MKMRANGRMKRYACQSTRRPRYLILESRESQPSGAALSARWVMHRVLGYRESGQNVTRREPFRPDSWHLSAAIIQNLLPSRFEIGQAFFDALLACPYRVHGLGHG